MSKVTITLEDLITGKISVRCEPNLATIAKLRMDQDLTPAEMTAVMALREIHSKFKKAEEITKRGLFERVFGSTKKS